jgi:hypothetical protein
MINNWTYSLKIIIVKDIVPDYDSNCRVLIVKLLYTDQFTKKPKLMGKGRQFTYTSTLPPHL